MVDLALCPNLDLIASSLIDLVLFVELFKHQLLRPDTLTRRLLEFD